VLAVATAEYLAPGVLELTAIEAEYQVARRAQARHALARLLGRVALESGVYPPHDDPRIRAVVVGERDELGKLCATRHTPRRPEREHHDASGRCGSLDHHL
jgi:hypothetical protein